MLFEGIVEQWIDDLNQVKALGVSHAFFRSRDPIEVQLEALTVLRGTAT